MPTTLQLRSLQEDGEINAVEFRTLVDHLSGREEIGQLGLDSED